MAEKKLFYPGHSSCAGCPEMIAVRTILDVAGKNTIISIPTGCLEITTTPYPVTSWGVPCIHVAFETGASVATGIASAVKALNKDANVIVIAGDGATYDIGFQALSGMLERKNNVCYICLDNGAYMNTGIQRSGATPYGAATTTSPAGKKSFGNVTFKKPIVEIAAAHRIPYAASASIGFLPDLKAKLKKALEKKPSFLNIDCPCPLGWRFESSKTIDVAKMNADCGLTFLYEIEDGKFTLNREPSKKASECVRMQGRFRHLTDDDIERIQAYINNELKRYKELR
ncbi:MAG: thiamine pyrophosphate-dependent enzyme [Candidatus Aenigmatarchaeota archaeon]